MKTKSIFKSKTLWVNVLLLIVAVGPELANLPDLQLSKEWIALIVLVANTALRLMTNSPATITGTGKGEEKVEGK